MQNDYNTGDQNFNLFTFDSSNNAFGSISGIRIGTIRSKWISMLKEQQNVLVIKDGWNGLSLGNLNEWLRDEDI